MRDRPLQPPPRGAYRKRLCMKCKVDLQADGFLVNGERGSLGHGNCEKCGKKDVVSAVYRYALSCTAQEKRGVAYDT